MTGEYLNDQVLAIKGNQRGDEGKGRFVDAFAAKYDIVGRYNGGPNAGHTVILPDGTEFDLHGIPSGVTHPNTMNVIGAGTLVDAQKLPGELDKLADKGIELTPDNLMISSAARLILPQHVVVDTLRENGERRQGSTKSGIAPCAADKALREGIAVSAINNDPGAIYERIIDELSTLRHEIVEERLPWQDEESVAYEYVTQALRLGEFVTDISLYLCRRLQAGDRLLAEGAQGFLLDIDHGMAPDTTSSSTTANGAPGGFGIPARYMQYVIGVSKAVQSHVGGGHFVTEVKQEEDPELYRQLHGDKSAVDAEVGTTTGRERRLGYLDLPGIRRAQMIDGDREHVITKLDWVPRYGDKLKVCSAYVRKGKMIDVAPDESYKLQQCTPLYEELENWTEDISEVRRFEDLPGAAKDYIEFIQQETDVPLTALGVGPRRDQVIPLK